jgi:hypothetical protein
LLLEVHALDTVGERVEELLTRSAEQFGVAGSS